MRRRPVVIGGALVVPICLFQRAQAVEPTEPSTFAKERQQIEALAMAKIVEMEQGLGRLPRDIHEENRGYDIESSIPRTGGLLFIEVKGRTKGARTITIKRNEILTALNKPEEYILALVPVDGDQAQLPCYVRRPFQREPDFGTASVNCDLDELFARAGNPA